MKISLLVIIALFVFAIVPISSTLAASPTRSRDSCMQLANQRGFSSGGHQQNRARRSFIGNCMKGRQS